MSSLTRSSSARYCAWRKVQPQEAALESQEDIETVSTTAKSVWTAVPVPVLLVAIAVEMTHAWTELLREYASYKRMAMAPSAMPMADLFSHEARPVSVPAMVSVPAVSIVYLHDIARNKRLPGTAHHA